MGNVSRRFRLGLVALSAGLLVAVPGSPAAARPQQNPFGMAELVPCHPVTAEPHLPVTLRPGATQTLGIPGYLMPAGMSYFGIGTAVGSPYLKNNLLVAPSSFTCTSDGYDQTKSGGWAQLNASADPDSEVFTWYYYDTPPADEGNPLMCQALKDAGMTAQYDDYARGAPLCADLSAKASYAADLPVAGTPLSIGYAIFPAGQPILPTTERYPVLEASIFEYTDPLTGTPPKPEVPVTSIDCALPLNEAAFCTETLAEWVQTQLTGYYGKTTAEATWASASLRAQIQQKPGPGQPPAAAPAPVTAGGCTAPLDEGIESKLAELKPVPLQAAPRKGESGPITQVSITAAFSPLEFHLCEEGLLDASVDTGAFEIGSPSMTVHGEDQQHHQVGPFVYDAQAHGWEKNAAIPAGQDLDTHYNASFRVELGPKVSATLDPAKIAAGGAPDIGLDLITVVLQARPQEVTLVKSQDGRELLQMVDSPQLTFSLEVSPREIEQEVGDGEAASKEPATEVINDVAEDIASQDSVAMADEIEETAGVSDAFARGTVDAVWGQIEDVVKTTFEDDPVLASVEARAVAEGALTAAEGDEGPAAQAEQDLEQLLDSNPEEDVKALAGDAGGLP